jgi:hypothetical protein
MSIFIEKIDLYKSVFHGRTDIYAVRREKNGRSGYMPAYYYDPYMYLNKQNRSDSLSIIER